MTVPRLIAIVFIFAGVSIAWTMLGTSIIARTDSGYDLLGDQVEELWGAAHVARAPVVKLAAPGQVATDTELDSSVITADLHLEQRRKGLLWYATYTVGFDGLYTFRNPRDKVMTATVEFRFPSEGTIYDGFEFRVGDTRVTPGGDTGGTLTAVVPVPPGQEETVHIAYRSRGLDTWRYSFAEQMTTVKRFALTVNTDFDDYNFLDNTISASTKTKTPQGWQLEWRFDNLVADFDLGVAMPHPLNPGPLASRMSYFAPISLLFFFTVLVVLGAVKGTNLHPMHYFFLGASFFAFHVLFAYLVDHVLLEVAFVIAAAVSMLLVISYLWRVIDRRFALLQGGVAQLLFLVLFSYAFFFEGYTGLVITIGAIITLAVLMQVTARVNWADVFGGKPKRGATAAPVAAAPPETGPGVAKG
jgi:hypothetical protein